jgi:transitional endoplasmic reticulum ATPase
MARMYQPAVVFAEDVDTMAGPNSGATIERHLDLLDGIKQKGLKLLTVFTTNHAEQIHKGMLRPGRIGAVISIGGMDRPGIEKLGRRVIGDALDPDTDWDEVADRTQGYMPAFVRECFDRAVRYAITLNHGELGQIGTEAICLAADGLRDQYRLMEDASEETTDMNLTASLGAVVQKAVDGVIVKDNDESDYERFVLSAPGNGH